MRSSATRLGEVLDDAFELEELVRSTGQLEIYRAKDQRTREAVRVQLLRPEFALHGNVVQSFLRGPRTLSELTHESLPRVRVGSDDTGIPFVVEEVVEGRPLSALIASFPQGLPLALVGTLSAPLIEALSLAHERGMVHGRIDSERVKLLGATHAPTPKWIGLGAPPDLQDEQDAVYRAPELGAGADALVTLQADVFAFGVLLYLMLSGELPFRSGKKGAVPIEEIAPNLPRSWVALTHACLDARLTKRLPHASAVFDELRACLQPGAAATHRRAPEPTVPDEVVRLPANARPVLRSVPSDAPVHGPRGARPTKSAPPRTVADAFGALAEERDLDTGSTGKPNPLTTVRRKPTEERGAKLPGITEERTGFDTKRVPLSEPPPADELRARRKLPPTAAASQRPHAEAPRGSAPREQVKAPGGAADSVQPRGGAPREQVKAPRGTADSMPARAGPPREPGKAPGAAADSMPARLGASPQSKSPPMAASSRTPPESRKPPRTPANAAMLGAPRPQPHSAGSEGPPPAAASWLASALVSAPPPPAPSEPFNVASSALRTSAKRPALTQGQVAAVALTEAQLETLRSLRSNDEPDRDRLIGLLFLLLFLLLLHFGGPLIGEPNMAAARATFGPRLQIVASVFSVVATIGALRMWVVQLQNPSLIGRIRSFVMLTVSGAIVLLTLTLFTSAPLLTRAAGYASSGLPWGLGALFLWFGFELTLTGARRLAGSVLMGALTLLLAGGSLYASFHALRAALQKDKHRITLPFVKPGIPTSIDELKRQAAGKTSLSNWQEQHQDPESLHQRQTVGDSEDDDMKAVHEMQDTRAKNKAALDHLGQTIPEPQQAEPSGSP